MASLQITEIFYSISGEANTSGLPTVFIRLTGCPLRCSYCDTSYAFAGGKSMPIKDILMEVSKYQPQYVLVTGGEPLAQENVFTLLTELCDTGYSVSLETGGMLDISKVDQRVNRVLDIKTPGSNEHMSNLSSNYQHLTSHDRVKFVICDEADFKWSKECITEYGLTDNCEVFFSASNGELSEGKLADWILKDRLQVRFQLQLHKVLWGDVAGK